MQEELKEIYKQEIALISEKDKHHNDQRNQEDGRIQNNIDHDSLPRNSAIF